MKLVIAEKPSVAMDIAKVLGAKNRKDGYMEGGGYVVSWCVGHLVGLAMPDAYDEKYKNRNIEDLPIFPAEWKLKLNEDTKSQFEVLKSLMERDDVDELVCATDAGREGEHIFRLVYTIAGSTKPFKRLWISSMESSAIQEGFENLKDGKEYDRLADAAMCRSKADWLVGINMSRLFTTTIGRVQTPTLALVVSRENAIDGFTVSYSYTVKLIKDNLLLTSKKMDSEEEAKALAEKINGKNATVTLMETKETKSNPPKLYDLTTLQREASRFFSLTAKETLSIAQKLYENKYITYPRTDSSFITEDMEESTSALILSLQASEQFSFLPSAEFEVKKVINNAKVSDHHALLPTPSIATLDFKILSDKEQKVLSMITARLLISTAPPELAENTKIEAECENVTFGASAKKVLSDGYRAVERAFKGSLKVKEDGEKEEKETIIPKLSQGDTLDKVESGINQIKAAPPQHFTEDTLLSAMERAGNEEYEDDETEKKGLGTPATMADIIENLIVRTNFLERKGKQILPTQRGKNLIELLPESLTSPKMTALWETNLQQMAKGQSNAEVFMKEIQDFICIHIAEFDELTPEQKALIPPPAGFERKSVGTCSRCKKSEVFIGKNSYYCGGDKETCGFFLMKEPPLLKNAKKKITPAMMTTLLKKGKVGVKGMYSAKKDTTYDAIICLNDPGTGYVNFKMEFPQKPKKKK